MANLNSTLELTTKSNSEIDNILDEYPIWHVIFWVSPLLQMFVVSFVMTITAIVVSYLTGIVTKIKSIRLESLTETQLILSLNFIKHLQTIHMTKNFRSNFFNLHGFLNE